MIAVWVWKQAGADCFTFKTDPLESSKCDFAVMGSEINSKYYEAASG